MWLSLAHSIKGCFQFLARELIPFWGSKFQNLIYKLSHSSRSDKLALNGLIGEGVIVKPYYFLC